MPQHPPARIGCTCSHQLVNGANNHGNVGKSPRRSAPRSSSLSRRTNQPAGTSHVWLPCRHAASASSSSRNHGVSAALQRGQQKRDFTKPILMQRPGHGNVSDSHGTHGRPIVEHGAEASSCSTQCTSSCRASGPLLMRRGATAARCAACPTAMAFSGLLPSASEEQVRCNAWLGGTFQSQATLGIQPFLRVPGDSRGADRLEGKAWVRRVDQNQKATTRQKEPPRIARENVQEGMRGRWEGFRERVEIAKHQNETALFWHFNVRETVVEGIKVPTEVVRKGEEPGERNQQVFRRTAGAGVQR